MAGRIRLSVPARPPSSPSVAVHGVAPLSASPATLPPDVVRLVDVLACIEPRRRRRLHELCALRMREVG